MGIHILKYYLSTLLIFLISIQKINSQDSLSVVTKNTERDKISSILTKIDSVILNGIDEQAYPGAVIYIAINDSVILHKAYGYHTYENSRKVETSHIYDLASVTKVTASTLALMKLYEEGKFQLDDPIYKYVSNMRFSKQGKITFRNALTHQAGLQSWIKFYEMTQDVQGYKKKYFNGTYSHKFPFKIKDSLYFTKNNYKFIKKQIKKSDFDPTKGYEYSDLFLYLIPELVENITKQSFIEYLEQNFYSPLECQTTSFNPLEKFPDSLIVPTEKDDFFRKMQIHGIVHDEGAALMNGISGHAGLFSNAEDLAKIWSMYLNFGKYGDVQYLKSQTISLFTTTQFPQQNNRRAIGFDKPLLEYDSVKSSIAKESSLRSFGHTGYTGPIVWADPENKLLFIFLCNRVYPTRNQTQIYKLNIRPTLHKYSYQIAEVLNRCE